MTTFFLQRNWDGSVALNEFVCWFYEEILRERKSDGNSTNEKSWWFQLFEEPGNKLLSQRTTLEMEKSSVLKCYMWKVNFTRKMKNAQLISMSLYLRQPCKLSSVKSKEVPLCCSNHIPHILAELSLTEFFNRKRCWNHWNYSSPQWHKQGILWVREDVIIPPFFQSILKAFKKY